MTDPTEDPAAPTPIEEAPPSVRDALESAIAEHAPDAAAEGPAASVPAASPRPDGAAAPRAPAAGAPPAGAPRAPATEAAPALAAPASWKAGLREYWKTLPPDVQGEIHRREGEQVERMRENATMRYHSGRSNQIVEPYRALMEAEGGEPLAAFHDYLRAATLLRTGAPNDRAQFVAALVHRYGVPLDALDAHLANVIRNGAGGQTPLYQSPQAGMPPQQMQPQQFRDPRLDALIAYGEKQTEGQIRNEVSSFKADGKHEFFDDVRLTMADVMDAAAKRGIEMGLEDAYQRACMIEPEVRKVMESRGMRMSASQAARTLAAARHASSSLSSGTAPQAAKLATVNGGAPSVRQSLEASIDMLRTGA